MMGLADDGGLLVPESVPAFTADELTKLSALGYPSLAYEIISRFATDIEPAKLKEIIEKSYAAFDTEEVIPVVKKGGLYIAEIFHGPTFAFKDIALQFLGNLFEHILEERGEKLNIVGATSGDTGSAAIYGVRGRKNIRIFILHPKGRVSPVQEMQMTSVTDENVFNLALSGTFDDCQDIVKEIFGDLKFKHDFSLGAVNSINWARVLAQIVYYFWCSFRAAENGRKPVFIVPTGNFGNIFAGYYAKLMGLPVEKFILATNENNILSRFINDGDYTSREVVATYSPSMDIQIASNFERYLYFFYNQDAAKVESLMKTLKTEKGIKFPAEDTALVQQEFGTYSATNKETEDVIASFYKTTGYTLDPHTACGVAAGLRLETESPIICLSTAHPAKFPDVVVKATGKAPEKPAGIVKLEGLPRKVSDMPNNAEAVKEFIRRNV
ncbi:MAG: threonine synthase [Geovibrio sp.]|nr:threonine synthase [Geovibrio sp.]